MIGMRMFSTEEVVPGWAQSVRAHMNRLAVRRALSLRRLIFPEDLFLNIQTLFLKAMSHCLNEVKVSLLLIAEIIIVVCPWDEKGKFSKICKKTTFLVIRFRSRDYPERVFGSRRCKWSGNKINESFLRKLLFLENAISELIINRELDSFCSFVKCNHKWRTWNFTKWRYISSAYLRVVQPAKFESRIYGS